MRSSTIASLMLAPLMLASASHAQSTTITVTIENLAPNMGTSLTPFWVGFHNGGFDLFNAGQSASPALEAIAEDGNTGPLTTLFAGAGFGSVQGTIASGGIPPITPGEITSMQFTLNASDPMSRYFSYASMIIPSNDAFVGNDNPLAFPIFDASGNFLGADFFIMGTMVRDAGTEVNDEVPMNTAFFGQTSPNTGVTENGVVGMHPGFLGSIGNPGPVKSILADPMFINADFTAPGYVVARVTIVPAPGAAAGLVLGAAVLARRRR